ncbi:GNAT family N-acetyltransferase [Neobacillus sp. SM06]|uniref:GNAT family N-acetyltransferase n=1 Tax=Neobacillus sp. SM06 TaxID=3422492 RepID=UPI003D2A34C8
MDILKKVLELDFAYLETFTNRIETEWGCYFYNEMQPNYYDANHAHVDSTSDDPKKVMADAISFYQKRNLTPRFYLYDLDRHQRLLAELKEYGFGVEEFNDPVQVWNRRITEQENDPRITIEQVTEDNFTEAMEIECSINELGGRSVREKAFAQEFRQPAYTHFLLRYEGTPCATACIFAHNNQARMESVATVEAFRGRGLIGHLIRHIQRVAAERKVENLWVFPISERVEKVYQKNGFDTIATIKTGHAFLGGKSIQEIHGG